MSAPQSAGPAPAGTPVGAVLMSSDPDGSAAFYQELFGWTVRPQPDGTRVVSTADGTAAAVVLSAPAVGEGRWPYGWLPCLAHPDPAALAGQIGGLGGTAVHLPGDLRPDSGLELATDPGGVPFAVVPDRQAVTRPGPGRPSWYELMTCDPAGSDAFYRAAFGYQPACPPGVPAGTDPAGTPYALLMAGGRPVAGRLHLPADLAGLLGQRWMVYLADSDVDAAAYRAATLGAEVLVPPRDTPTGRVTALRDPQHAVFTVLRPAA